MALMVAATVVAMPASARPAAEHAHFESGDLHGFSPGPHTALSIVRGDDARQGKAALAVDIESSVVPGEALAHWDVTTPASATFVTVWVKGVAGRVVQVAVGQAASPPVRLDGTWQIVGLSLDGAGAATRVDVVARGVHMAGDRVMVDDGRIAPSGAARSTVADGSRVVLVNGEPFVAKGYLYWTLPIGQHWPASTWADPPACQQDARLLGAAGVTLLRIPFEDHAPQFADSYRACLDAFHANGIGVLWLIGPPTQLESVLDTPVTADLYGAKVRSAVDTVGEHPATLLWTIGNEIERSNDGKYWLGDKASGAPALLEELIQRGKAADGARHLWGTTICCPDLHWLRNANVPSLDFWGINAYHRSWQSYYEQLNVADPRPKLLTETGTDRYFCRPGIAVDRIVQTCRTSYRNPAGHSGERQEQQRDWNLEIWDQMVPNVATPERPDGAVFGATFFMWSDLWWFSLGFLTPQSPAQRQVGGVNGWAAPDGIINIEFHGVANAQPAGINEPRVTSLAFDALAARWGTAPPTISDVRVDVDVAGAQITASWRTSEPATSEVQSGANGEDGRDGGDMREDNTIFGMVAYDGVLRTEHSLTFTAPTLDPGLCQKIVARSFTSDGRSVTTPPFIAGCPSTGRTG